MVGNEPTRTTDGGAARGSIVGRLAGKRVFLTGVTGFLGQVVLERLLADFPETTIALLVRSQTGASSFERVHYLTRKPSFDRLRGSVGSDEALLGAMNLYRGVLAGGSRPALVHVSTAYVAGVQKGVIPERTLDHRVDWRLEADLAMRARGDVEAASRKPELLERFLA